MLVIDTTLDDFIWIYLGYIVLLYKCQLTSDPRMGEHFVPLW